MPFNLLNGNQRAAVVFLLKLEKHLQNVVQIVGAQAHRVKTKPAIDLLHTLSDVGIRPCQAHNRGLLAKVADEPGNYVIDFKPTFASEDRGGLPVFEILV